MTYLETTTDMLLQSYDRKLSSCNQLIDSSLEQGWRRVESTRLLPIWPGFQTVTRHHVWIEFVGSLLCSQRVFPRYSGFPLSPKTNTIWFVVIQLICSLLN